MLLAGFILHFLWRVFFIFLAIILLTNRSYSISSLSLRLERIMTNELVTVSKYYIWYLLWFLAMLHHSRTLQESTQERNSSDISRLLHISHLQRSTPVFACFALLFSLKSPVVKCMPGKVAYFKITANDTSFLSSWKK